MRSSQAVAARRSRRGARTVAISVDDQRRGQRRAADLLGERRDGDHLHADAAGRLRHGERRPAELDHLLPEPLVAGEPAAPRSRRPRDGRAATSVRSLSIGDVLVEEACAPESRTICSSAPKPKSFGCAIGRVLPTSTSRRPSTRSPRMLRWISFVPAAIVMPYEFMYASGQWPPSGAPGSPQVEARARALDLERRARRCPG